MEAPALRGLPHKNVLINSPERQSNEADAGGKIDALLITYKILDKLKLLDLQITAPETVMF